MRLLLVITFVLFSSAAQAAMNSHPYLGTKSLLLILVGNYPAFEDGNNIGGIQAVNFASNRINKMSSGLATLNGEVAGPYYIPFTDGCDTTSYVDIAKNRAFSQGYSTAQYYAFAFAPGSPNCPPGWALVNIYLNGILSGNDLLHEFGHQLGLSHADGLICEPINKTPCESIPNANARDNMSQGGVGDWNVYSQAILNWVTANGTQSVTNITANGTYLLEDFWDDGPSSYPKAIKITRPGFNNSQWWLQNCQGNLEILFGSDGLTNAYAIYQGIVPGNPLTVPNNVAFVDGYTGISITAHTGPSPNSLLIDVLLGGMLPGDEQSLFTSQTPISLSQNDGVTYELGTAIRSDVAGQITAIRYWKGPNETGSHVGHLWNSNGQLLASVNFTNETSSGWQQQLLSTPVSITANVDYVVSVSTGTSTYFTMTGAGLSNQIVNGHLRSLSTGGRFGSPNAFPPNSSINNYFRDVVFVEGEVTQTWQSFTPLFQRNGNQLRICDSAQPALCSILP